jgi:hypothetical protein
VGRHVARAAGETCRECSSAPAPGRVRCKPCLAVAREREAARREAHRAAGRCVVCGRKAMRERSMCNEHLAYYRARTAERAATK